MLEKIFSWSRKKPEEEAEPAIRFGRYSDNNKTVDKVEMWNEDENGKRGAGEGERKRKRNREEEEDSMAMREQ